MPLNLKPNSAQPDTLYQTLVDLHEGLSDEESLKVGARMILLLANHIGDVDVVAEAARIARGQLNNKDE